MRPSELGEGGAGPSPQEPALHFNVITPPRVTTYILIYCTPYCDSARLLLCENIAQEPNILSCCKLPSMANGDILTREIHRTSDVKPYDSRWGGGSYIGTIQILL